MPIKSRPSKTLTDIVTRHQVFLEMLKTHEAQDFANVFDKIDTAVRQTVMMLETDTLDKLTRKEFTKLLIDLRATSETMLSRSAETFFTRLESISEYEAEFEVKTFASLSKDIALIMPKAQITFANVLAQPMTATGDLLKPFVDNFSKNETKRLNNTVQRAWGEGWTNQRLIQSIRGTKALNYKDGILATSRRNAESIARTSIQHTASASKLAVWEKNADVVQSYSICATLDSRTTIICRSMDGRIFKRGAGPITPLHINCRSAMIPELGKEWDWLKEGETRSSVNGYVDGDLTYYEWLKTQPKNFQVEALGKSRAELFDKGGLSADEFARLNLNRNFQPLTLEQMKAKEPLAFERAGLN